MEDEIQVLKKELNKEVERNKILNSELEKNIIETKNTINDVLKTIIELQDKNIESNNSRDERKNKTLTTLFITFSIAFFLNNAIWLYVFSHREIVTETITTTQESNGDSNIVNGNNYQDNAVHIQEKQDNKNKVIGGANK